MASEFSKLVADTRSWMEAAVKDGWLVGDQLNELALLSTADKGPVFAAEQGKPLVVAFFGGTGVGKSSLLNRLAGDAVAKTGVERPTSREVTIYMHDSIELTALPDDLPMEQIRLAKHHDPQWQDVAWIDMPDIDSVESHNRTIVEQWLPHVDLLVYVMSPERYRDERGWRFLQSQAAGHGWVFVMNQWDRGDQSQMTDLQALLTSSGFPDPVLFRTVCKEPRPADVADDFEALVASIKTLANRQTVAHLEARNQLARQMELKNTIRQALASMGESAQKKDIQQYWAKRWQQTSVLLEKGLEWPAKYVANAFIGRYKGLPALAKLPHQANDEKAVVDDAQPPVLWDAWAQTRFEDAIDALILDADSIGIPVEPYRQALLPVREEARESLLGQAQQALREALVKPGNWLQRILMPLFKLLAFVLPVASASWVGYRVVDLYYQNGSGEMPYLGMDFAIHSGLLLLLSWLLPWFVLRNVKPSIEKTAGRGIQAGLQRGLDLLDTQVLDALELTLKERERHQQAAQQLLLACEQEPMLPESQVSDELLQRILSSKKIDGTLRKQRV